LTFKGEKMYNKLKLRKGRTMEKAILYILFIGLFVSAGFASYTYEVYTYSSSKILYNEETILVDLQGGMGGLTLFNDSSATIKGTSLLSEGFGGIWYLDLADRSNLTMTGGQIHELNPHTDATILLAGGIIQRIKSSQNAWKWEYPPDPPVLVPNPHITIECLDHFHNGSTNVLTGHWLDSTPFIIQLIDVQGYSPAIENIQFIPEPASLALLALGSLLIHKKK
jgi:hypothetical protein